MIKVGNRVPHEYFLTEGSGESDITVHAGSYHLALREAGIEMANQIKYSSILPGSAVEIARPTHQEFVHGEVMETITAEATCEYGSTATAGLIFGWLYDKVSGGRHGALVCEYGGSLKNGAAEQHLREMLKELHTNGYEHFDLRDINIRTRTIEPVKMYGTAIVAICFTSYLVPFTKNVRGVTA